MDLTDGGGLGEAISPMLYPSTPLRVSALDTWDHPQVNFIGQSR
ncbi:hypothetical protein MC7420_1412 [Coleofasciculus chthonoplastes PCC 7420]|uniref:Uncharacterized protein n=1 Tax=Coleofasciculus chthonoplastes PCC 7420 TaxID=118168 RepID=B4VRL4_9CYAN|nr:hypothetical protein MC7420_1412 [Coleofasciculus chthonoplastes PCC 7420]